MKEHNEDSKRSTRNATIFLILANLTLFIFKIIVGIISNSISVISDAINSFTDIISSIVVFVCVKMGCKEADEEHPFGHHRIEPIAGLVVALFIAIVGFEVIKISVGRILTGDHMHFSLAPVIVLIFTMCLKFFMFVYFRKVSSSSNSPALAASSIDCRNDVFISATALLGVLGSRFGHSYLDSVVGIFIGLWIIYSGYGIGMSNIDFLIGKSPDKETMKQIREAALSVKGVKGLNDVRAHYVGNYFHAELHIELSKRLSLEAAHDIGKKVEHAVESLPGVKKAFIHIDPV